MQIKILYSEVYLPLHICSEYASLNKKPVKKLQVLNSKRHNCTSEVSEINIENLKTIH